MKNNRLQEFIDNPKISLWKLSIPMMLGMSVQAIYMLIDTAFIGKWVGWKALTGLGVVFPALFIIMGVTFGIGSGATTVIAQYIGAKDKENADNAAAHTILLGIIIGIIKSGVTAKNLSNPGACAKPTAVKTFLKGTFVCLSGKSLTPIT